jgi:serine/threonine-protein kinase
MNNNDVIASVYKISENIANFQSEQLFWVENLNNKKAYLLQHIDLKNRSDTEITSIKQKINQIQNLQDKERFAVLIEIKEEDNSINLIYEKLPEGSLAKTSINYQDKSEAEIIKIIKYALESLKILHEHGLVHQMINPQNMSLNQEQTHLVFNHYGKITADLYSSLMVTISVEDTLYITQEQLRGQASFSCDIYALGRVIITSIMGINILDLDDTDGELLKGSESENYTENFKNILNKMVNSKINQRYSNVDEVLADLNQYFPETTPNNYTPTEIILPDTEKQAEISSSSSVLNPTQISLPDEHESVSNNQETVSSDDVNNISATELVSPSEIEATEDNLPTDNLNSPEQDYHPQMEAISTNFSERNNVNTDVDQPLAPPENNPSHHQSNLSAHNSWVNLMKTPTGIGAICVFVLVIVFGVNAYKNYLQEKKVEELTANIELFYNNEEFDDCIALINSQETQALVIAEQISEQFLGKCWLGLALQEASQGNFSQAINIAVKINNKSADYERARKFVDDWSEELWKEAQIICEEGGDISSVQIKLASIPESSKWKKEALDLVEQCQQQPHTGNTIDLCPGPLCPE